MGASIWSAIITVSSGTAGFVSLPFFLAGGLMIVDDLLLDHAFVSRKTGNEC